MMDFLKTNAKHRVAVFSSLIKKNFPNLLVVSTSLIAQSVKNPPAMQETWVRFLSQEDSLDKEMATHSGILAWRIPWVE